MANTDGYSLLEQPDTIAMSRGEFTHVIDRLNSAAYQCKDYRAARMQIFRALDRLSAAHNRALRAQRAARRRRGAARHAALRLWWQRVLTALGVGLYVGLWGWIVIGLLR